MSTAVSAISKLKGYSNIRPEHEAHFAKVAEYAGKVASRSGGTLPIEEVNKVKQAAGGLADHCNSLS